MTDQFYAAALAEVRACSVVYYTDNIVLILSIRKKSTLPICLRGCRNPPGTLVRMDSTIFVGGGAQETLGVRNCCHQHACFPLVVFHCWWAQFVLRKK
mmetsp:Transcript_6815/g.10011  ORF Transcript_6815/g.10011 Transcript_6815/m.10011 type:complete len:98 (+) Transcript_6815:950-1243(+)